MFTYNNNSWEFSATLTVVYYYGIMTLMIGVNTWFCLKENEKTGSLRNMIGKVSFKSYIKSHFKPDFQELCLIVSCQS